MVVVDSPIAESQVQLTDDELEGSPLWFVLWKALPNGLWRVWNRDNGNLAVATSLEHGEAMLAEAKKVLAEISRKSKTGNLAAVELRLAHSPANEL